MKKILITVLAATGVITAKGQNTDTLKNDAIIKMHQSGFSSDVIIKRIQTAPLKNFDLSTDALILLKKESIPDTIVLAMMEQPEKAILPKIKELNQAKNLDNKVASSYDHIKQEGLYYYDEKSRKFLSIPNNPTSRLMPDAKTYITGGLSEKYEYQFPNTKAIVGMQTYEPEFFLKVNNMNSVLKPNDFILFKGEVVSRKKIRKALWTGNGFTDRNKLPRNAIVPNVERINDDLFKLTFPDKLQRGNYFLGPREHPHHVCFDFDIIDNAGESSKAFSKETSTAVELSNTDDPKKSGNKNALTGYWQKQHEKQLQKRAKE